ncbi:MAG: sel1 repeat family protein [Holdemanella sp.]|nr:sel1 repeat family protein [Holdemanella sp.]
MLVGSIYYNQIDINSLKEDVIEVYRSEVLEGVANKQRDKMAVLAYDCYGGNKAFACDFYKSRDLLLELMELWPEKNGQWANTLGYIYYYGRCNDGIPEYDKAFKCFSLGDAYGYYESTYKLADMYLKGRGVIQDERAAYYLIYHNYDENLNKFLERKDNVLADLALRVGSMTYKGQGVEKNRYNAYWYYLVAEYAIKERMKVNRFFGNKKVYDIIQKGLEKCRSHLKLKNGTVLYNNYPMGIESALMDNHIVKVTVKEKDDVYTFETTRLKSDKRIIVASVENSYVEFLDKTIDYCDNITFIHIMDRSNSFICDEYRFDFTNNLINFYLFDSIVAVIEFEYFTFYLNDDGKDDRNMT